jgi:hypothetical protein
MTRRPQRAAGDARPALQNLKGSKPYAAKSRREKFSLRRLQTGRRKPLLHVGGGFSLPRSTQKPLAFHAGRGAFRLFS